MKHVGFFLALAVFTSGCATQIPFTHDLRDEYELDSLKLKQLQYYVSDTITLQRELSSEEKTVAPGHKLLLSQDKRIEEILILKGTEGLAIGSDPNTLEISFEKGNSLTFASIPELRELWGGKYALGAEEWDDDGGKLTYEGKDYWAVLGSNNVYLLVGSEALRKFEKKSRVVPGLKFEE